MSETKPKVVAPTESGDGAARQPGIKGTLKGPPKKPKATTNPLANLGDASADATAAKVVEPAKPAPPLQGATKAPMPPPPATTESESESAAPDTASR